MTKKENSMSMTLMVQAMNARVGNPLRKLVLIKLADNANDMGECWPSYQHIADQCEIARSSVRKHIKTLEQAGFLRIENREGPKGNSSNLYYLTIDKGVAQYDTPVVPKITGVVPDSTGAVVPDSTRTSHSFETVKEPVSHIGSPVGHIGSPVGHIGSPVGEPCSVCAGLGQLKTGGHDFDDGFRDKCNHCKGTGIEPVANEHIPDAGKMVEPAKYPVPDWSKAPDGATHWSVSQGQWLTDCRVSWIVHASSGELIGEFNRLGHFLPVISRTDQPKRHCWICEREEGTGPGCATCKSDEPTTNPSNFSSSKDGEMPKSDKPVKHSAPDAAKKPKPSKAPRKSKAEKLADKVRENRHQWPNLNNLGDDMLNEWAAHRTRKNASDSDRALTAIEETLEYLWQHGISAEKAIGEQLDSGWTTIKVEYFSRLLGENSPHGRTGSQNGQINTQPRNLTPFGGNW